MSGAQALNICAHIEAFTYTRDDLQGKHKIGLMAQDVEQSLEQLGIDNIVSSTIQSVGEEPAQEYKTLDYARLVALTLPALNELSRRVKELEPLVNGANRKPSA